MNRLLLVFFFAFGMYAAQSQPVHVKIYFVKKVNAPESDTIYYWKEQKLTWNDFQGTPPANHFGGAITASGIQYASQMHQDKNGINIDIYVKCYFSKSHSWKKPEIKAAYHLEHEQRHFDITYLAAIKLVNDLGKAEFTVQNWSKQLNQIYNDNIKLLDETQRRYDKETNHSVLKEKQLEWNNLISEKLAMITVSR